jgi:hypothetical protein
MADAEAVLQTRRHPMSISGSAIAQSLHSTLHKTGTNLAAPMQRRQQFEKTMQNAAAAQSGQSAPTQSGSLLSTQMLQALQTVGSGS